MKCSTAADSLLQPETIGLPGGRMPAGYGPFVVRLMNFGQNVKMSTSRVRWGRRKRCWREEIRPSW